MSECARSRQLCEKHKPPRRHTRSDDSSTSYAQTLTVEEDAFADDLIKAAVPSLVASVKDAGLLLATFGQPSDVSVLRQGASDGRTVDAFVIDGWGYVR